MAPETRPSKAKKEYSYSADRPIATEKDDLLGRAPFAKNLANDIRAWGGHDSLVIALYGGWGCGKTSLKNLILRASHSVTNFSRSLIQSRRRSSSPLRSTTPRPSAVRPMCTVLAMEVDYDPFLSYDTATVAWRLAFRSLRKEKDPSKRFEILRSAFADSDGIFFPTEIVSLEKRESQGDNAGHEYLLSEEDQKKLQEMCVEKIREAARKVTLRSRSRSDALLWKWRAWAPEEEVRDWVAQECAKPEAAAWLLASVRSRSSSGSEVRFYIRLSDVARYADVLAVEAWIAEMDETVLSDKERHAVKEFHRAIKRRNEGKPDFDGYRHSPDED